MKKYSKLLALLLSVAMMCSLAACGGSSSSGTSESSATEESSSAETTAAESSEESESAGDAAATGGTFVFGTDANSTTFDPASDLQTNSGGALVAAVLETLWTVDSDGSVTCKLATDYEWTGDLELTVNLQEGVTFSNGNALTSDDVLYTMEHLAETARTSSMVACVDFDATTCPDATTIVIVFNTYDASFFDTMGNASFGILDRETCTADGFEWGWMIGTGPYQLQGDGSSDVSGWEESVQYTLVRNENYWGDAPYYDEIIIKFYSEESTRYAELQAGNLDAAYLTEATYVNGLNDGAVSGASLVQKEAQGVYGFALASSDESTGALSDINIRKAFAHALDVETMISSLGEGVYQVASGILGEDNWAYLNTGIYEYDPDYAAECLAEAGYSVDNPYTVYLVAESTAFNSALAEAAQSYLAAVGINLDLTGLGDFATILPTLLAGEQDITISTGSNGSGSDPASLLQQFGPVSDNVLLRVTDSDLVSLFNDGSASRDQDERVEIYAEFQQMMYDGYYYIPLYIETKNYGVMDEHTSFESALNATNQLDVTLLTD